MNDSDKNQINDENVETRRQQREDHDTLIRLESSVDGIINKIDEFKKDIKNDLREIKDDTKATIDDHENRIKTLERSHERVNIDSLKKELDDAKLWQRDFMVRWKFVLATSSAIGAIVGFLATFLSLIVLSWGVEL